MRVRVYLMKSGYKKSFCIDNWLPSILDTPLLCEPFSCAAGLVDLKMLPWAYSVWFGVSA